MKKDAFTWNVEMVFVNVERFIRFSDVTLDPSKLSSAGNEFPSNQTITSIVKINGPI